MGWNKANMRALCGLLTSLAMTCAGCALCPPGYLDDYPTVGGKWERLNPTSGRVGSILSDPGTGVSVSTIVQPGDRLEVMEAEGDVSELRLAPGESILEDYDTTPSSLDLSPPSYETQFDGSPNAAAPARERTITLDERW